jgi:ABC-type dipeptide/oligopeptide/nickel transport system ATPase component
VLRRARTLVIAHRGACIVELGAVKNVFTGPSADYTRQLLANTPSIEAALGTAAVGAD